jgi:succinylglutamic semialdehyde dehydrogenase
MDAVIKRLVEGQKEWAFLSLEDRVAVLMRYKDLLIQHHDEIAQLIHDEVGKVIWEAKQEAAIMPKKIDASLDAFQDRCKQLSSDLPHGRSITRHRPHGVVVVLGPFNFPAHLPNGHCVPALLAGNAVVLKPSEKAPKTAEKMVSLMHLAGIPENVIQIVHGGADCANELIHHPDTHAIFFTGSSKVGKHIESVAQQYPRKCVALEMGGNNPLIVSSYEDMNAAALVIIQSAFITTGQRCTCARRLIVIDSPENRALMDNVVSVASTIKVGRDPDAFMGPLVSEAQAEHIVSVFDQTVKQGGVPMLAPRHLGSAVITPGVIDVTTLKMPDEEYFGPLSFVTYVTTFEEAVEEANNTAYGLSAGILSTSRHEYDRFRMAHHAGLINWNVPTTGASSRAPFGGVGLSGNFRPSAYYAADYCAYPVASIESDTAVLPKTLPPGVSF